MNDELNTYIEDNLHDLVSGFANTVQEAKYIKDDWESGDLEGHPVIGDFIAYCEEALNNAIDGERAKKDSL